MVSQIKGSAAVITSQGVSSVKADDTYFVGYVPVYTLIWFHLSDHPFWLAFLSILTLLLISFYNLALTTGPYLQTFS
nr:hypothetical protein [Pseudoalteromonas sp. WY3]